MLLCRRVGGWARGEEVWLSVGACGQLVGWVVRARWWGGVRWTRCGWALRLSGRVCVCVSVMLVWMV